jgi:hypothetical protein
MSAVHPFVVTRRQFLLKSCDARSRWTLTDSSMAMAQRDGKRLPNVATLC